MTDPMITLTQALLRMPPNFYLKIQSYEDEEEKGLFYLGATIMEEPPEDGWTIPTYFNEPPGVKRAHTEEWLERYRHDDVARGAVSVSPEDPAPFENLLLGMLTRRWKKPSDVEADPEAELKGVLLRRLDSCFCDDVGQLPECRRCLAIREVLRIIEEKPEPPIPMVLHCPKCHVQHVDRGEWATAAKAHQKHLCEACGHTWKPSAIATVGVERLPQE